MSSPPVDALFGRLVDGRYRVTTRLATGGMATVYLATDERLDRDVALKILRPDSIHDPSFVERFRREATVAASLGHPNIVGVYDQGTDGDIMYLAMEYVHGNTLREILDANGPCPPEQALVLIDQILSALAFAHSAGVVHRDIKPENVIVRADGTVKVADFGLARPLTEHSIGVHSGSVLGSVAYVSPEQVEGRLATTRSDVYAAGLVLFELLVGAPAFAGETHASIALQHLQTGLPVPSSRRPGLPRSLDALVLTAAARLPEDRFADGSAFLTRVRGVRGELAETSADADANSSGHEADSPVLVSGATTPFGSLARSATAPSATAPSATAPGATAPSATAPIPISPAPISPTPWQPSEAAVIPLPPPPVDDGPRRRRWPILLLLALLAGAVAGWFFLLGPGARTTVPATAKLNQQAAVATVTKAGLKAAVEPVFSETVPVGVVVDSDPAAGARARKNSTVTLHISKGQERYAVPTLAGRTVEQARTALTTAHLTLGAQTEAFSPTVPAGQVISSDPKAGARVKPDTAVAIVVSKGKEPVTIPDVTNRPQSAATKALTALGLVVDATRSENSDTIAKGNVISQTPGPGAAYKGDKVTLLISKGPVLVSVPNVVGKQVDRATRILEDAGFRVRVEGLFGGIFGTVRFQSENPGAMVPKGSTITIQTV